jgi:hypothetical protein
VNYTVVKGSPTHEYLVNMAGAENELYHKWKVINVIDLLLLFSLVAYL